MEASRTKGAAQNTEPTPGPSRLLRTLISVGALLVAVVHLVWPDLGIDAVTLALFVIAIAPWLGPIFSSVELPGGWKFEYQQIQRQMEDVQRRVEGVERLLISGDTTPALEDKLTAAVQEFAAYLRAVNETLRVPPPSVALRRGLANAQYDGRVDEIQLDPDFADDDYAVLREYAHHVLMTIGPQWNTDYLGLESGLADYLVASYTGKPELGAALASRLRERYGDAFDRPYVRNLDNDLRLDSVREGGAQAEGEVWGAAFWELRRLLGQGRTDQALAAAWLDGDWRSERASPAAFPGAVLREVTAPERASARDAFERRGLPLPD